MKSEHAPQRTTDRRPIDSDSDGDGTDARPAKRATTAASAWAADFADLLVSLPQTSASIQEDSFHDRLASAVAHYARDHPRRALAVLAAPASARAIAACLEVACPSGEGKGMGEEEVDGRLALFAARMCCLQARLWHAAPRGEREGETAFTEVLVPLMRRVVKAVQLEPEHVDPHLVLAWLELLAEFPLERSRYKCTAPDAPPLRACLAHPNYNPLLAPLLSPTHASPSPALAGLELAAAILSHDSPRSLLPDELALVTSLAVASPHVLVRRKVHGLFLAYPATFGDVVPLAQELVARGWAADAVHLLPGVASPKAARETADACVASGRVAAASVVAAMVRGPKADGERLAWSLKAINAGGEGKAWPFHAVAQYAVSLGDIIAVRETVARSLAANRADERHVGECLLALREVGVPDSAKAVVETLTEHSSSLIAGLAAGLLGRAVEEESDEEEDAWGDAEEARPLGYEAELRDLLVTVHFYQARRGGCDEEGGGHEHNWMDCY
ncbi:hypothetical protein H9P43_008408 [Blastocladiella emersonii ATCC 22665]|nr:hypothetical protein H9P43_008408 [Blastocladiella emersonii ATCC 22665]